MPAPWTSPNASANESADDAVRLLPVSTATLRILDIQDRSGDLRSLRLENLHHSLPLDYPGRFAKLGVTSRGRTIWHAVAISSSATESSELELMIETATCGVTNSDLLESIAVGDWVKLAGPQGDFYFDPERHLEPLVLMAADASVARVISILRFLEATGNSQPCQLLHFVQPNREVPLYDECRRLSSRLPGLVYSVISRLSGPGWRLNYVDANFAELDAARFFVAGPSEFSSECVQRLLKLSVPAERIEASQQ